MVCDERFPTGNLYSYLDSSYFYLRHLFQAVRTYEAKKPMNFDLIYGAIVVFSVMIVGLVLTVIEFKKLAQQELEKSKARPKNG
jgi:hypothetical protein